MRKFRKSKDTTIKADQLDTFQFHRLQFQFVGKKQEIISIPQKFNEDRASEFVEVARAKSEKFRDQSRFWRAEALRRRLEYERASNCLLAINGGVKGDRKDDNVPQAFENLRATLSHLDSLTARIRRILRKLKKTPIIQHALTEQPNSNKSPLFELKDVKAEAGPIIKGYAILTDAVQSILDTLEYRTKQMTQEMRAMETEPIFQTKVKRDILAREKAQRENKRRVAGLNENAALKQQAEARKWEEFWRKIIEDPELQKRSFFAEIDGSGFHEFEALTILAKYDDEAVNVLSWKARLIVMELVKLCSGGDRMAAKELARLAVFATEGLNESIPGREPLVAPLSRKVLEWPLLVTRKNRQDAFQRYGDEFLEKIELGKESVLENFSTAKWKVKDPAGELAWQLWRYVDQVRGRVLFAKQGPQNEGWFSFTPLETRTGDLLGFSSKHWESWWKIAKEFLLEAYKDAPITFGEIGKAKKPGFETTEGFRATKAASKKRFWEALREKFESFSGVHSRNK